MALILELKRRGVSRLLRRQEKTSTLLAIRDENGFIVSLAIIIAGNRHDNYQLKPHLSSYLKWMEYPVLRLKEDRLNGEKGLRPKRLAKAASIIGQT